MATNQSSSSRWATRGSITRGRSVTITRNQSPFGMPHRLWKSRIPSINYAPGTILARSQAAPSVRRVWLMITSWASCRWGVVVAWAWRPRGANSLGGRSILRETSPAISPLRRKESASPTSRSATRSTAPSRKFLTSLDQISWRGAKHPTKAWADNSESRGHLTGSNQLLSRSPMTITPTTRLCKQWYRSLASSASR